MRTSVRHYYLSLLVGITSMGCMLVQTQVHAADIGQEELLRIIKAQQKQLAVQQKQIETQNKLLQEIQSETKSLVENAGKKVERLGTLVNEQQQQLQSLQHQVAISPKTVVVAGAGAPSGHYNAATTTAAQAQDVKQDKKVVTSGGGDRFKLAISGHVNRMVSIIDDGRETDTYHVDNDASESQVRFVGTARVNDDVTLGGTIELSIAPNKSGNLDQLNQEQNNIFDQRKAEITLDSKRWGKLWMGKGDTASYGAGAVDLSGTDAISYSVIADLAGSVFFRESDSGKLTDLRIFQAFNSFEGLNRASRLRYDTPRFNGFRASTSFVSEDRYDAALRWGGQGYGIKAAGGVAIADPKIDNADLQYNGSFSVLHEDTGLNATLAIGLLERDGQDDGENYFGKIGVIKKLFPVGDTAFSIDYTSSLNLPTSTDDGYSYALAAVQQFDDYGSELFAIYRSHSLDRDSGPDVDDIDVISVGARVKF